MAYLVHSQLWMSFSGLALILGIADVHRVSLSPSSCIIIFCGLMWVYLLDATAKRSPEDKVNQRPRVEFFRKHALGLGVLRMICLVVALYLTLQMRLPKESWYFLAASAVCSWAYSMGFRGRRLKNISLNKTWLIALAWTGGAFGAIWALHGLDVYIVSKGLVLVLLALLFFDTALLDWRDLKGDLAHGVKSIFTERGLSWKVHTFIAVIILITGFAQMIRTEDWPALKMAAGFSLAFVVVSVLAHKSKSTAVFSFCLSSWRMVGLVPLLLYWYSRF